MKFRVITVARESRHFLVEAPNQEVAIERVQEGHPLAVEDEDCYDLTDLPDEWQIQEVK